MAKQGMRPSAGIKLKSNLRGVLKLHEALKILAMPAVDLRETIQGYLASNPIIEEKQPDPKEIEIENPGYDYPMPSFFQNDQGEEQFKSHEKTIREILREEPQLAFEDEKSDRIKEFLIGNINDDGFLICTLDECTESCSCSHEEAEDVLRLIQDTAPAGVGARSVEEALLLKASAHLEGEELRIAVAIITTYHELLRKRKFGEVAKLLETSSEAVFEVWEKLSRFTFSPGANYAPKATYITPEIAIRFDGDQISILPIKNGIPHIGINNEYAHMLQETSDDETKEYLRGKMHEAKWLIRAIDQRKQNIMRIVSEVVRVQLNFFQRKTENLKPLTLHDVASRLELAPSTVSRAINSKYILTPYGTFPLKHFSLAVSAAKTEWSLQHR